MQHLLLLHGAIGSAQQLQPLADVLKENYVIHMPDLPGHGGEPLPEKFTLTGFADAVIDYCRVHKLGNVSIFGYSMGGYVGMLVAQKAPGLVDKLITLATKFHWDENIAAREVKMLQPSVIREKLPQFAADLEKRHAPQNWELVLSKTAGMLVEMGRNNPLQPSDYEIIQIPALIMLGDRDKMVSMEETLNVYKALPAASLAVLPQTPHPLEQVDTSLLASMIRRFIS